LTPAGRGSIDAAEVVRRGYEAYRSRGLRGWSRVWEPEIELDMTTTGITGFGVYRGRDEALAFLEEWSSAFEPLEVTLDEVTNLSDRSALAVYTIRGRPVVGGPSVTMRYAQIVEVSDWRIVKVSSYTDVEKARRAGRLLREPA
jgi:ketosteroid isomerase-like protein